MKIGIDLRQLVLGASGGLSQHVNGVCERMFALYPEHEFLVFCTPFNRSLLDYEAGHVRYFSLPIATYFRDMDQLIIEEELQVLFRAYPMEDTLQFPLQKQIILIPDNQHETYPEFFSPEALRTRRVAFANALGKAGAIGTNSEFSRKALLDFPETRCKDVFLMGPSLQAAHELGKGRDELAESELALIPQCDYFLFPANLWKHKNHHRLLQAFKLFKNRTEREVRLILTGHPEGWPELSQQFPGLPVTHLGFVRAELLRVLFERARALVFFSLYEGFGIPLLEAFHAGTPVLCSNTTSLPEVGGDAVLSCDPTDIEAMATLMERILEDDELRETLVQRGKYRLGMYSWEESAHNLMAACGRVAAAAAAAVPQLRAPLPLVSIVTPSYNQGRFIRRTIGRAVRRLERLGIIGEQEVSGIRRLLARTESLLRPKTAVIGFLADNWLEPILTVGPRPRASGQILHIAGVAPVDTVVTVKAENKEIHTSELKGGQYAKISFSADSIGNAPINILFSAFSEDEGKRQRAFLLQDTNLFSEQDIWR
jgi:glycosyltransferase involved in cell wall biosynthesis